MATESESKRATEGNTRQDLGQAELGYCDRHRWLHAKDSAPTPPCRNWTAGRGEGLAGAIEGALKEASVFCLACAKGEKVVVPPRSSIVGKAAVHSSGMICVPGTVRALIEERLAALEAAAPPSTPTWDDAYAAGVKLRDAMRETVERGASERTRPSIEELEAILNSESSTPVEILRDGSVREIAPFGALTECEHQHPRYSCTVCSPRKVGEDGALTDDDLKRLAEIHLKMRGWYSAQDLDALFALLRDVRDKMLSLSSPIEPEIRLGVHLQHCNFGEYPNACKYRDDDCPALTESWSWFGKALERARAQASSEIREAAQVIRSKDRQGNFVERSQTVARQICEHLNVDYDRYGWLTDYLQGVMFAIDEEALRAALATPSPQAPHDWHGHTPDGMWHGCAEHPAPAATQEQPAGSEATPQVIADLQIALRIVGDWKEDSRGLVHVHKDVIRKAIVAALRSAGNSGSPRKVGEDGALATYLLNTSPPDWEYDKVITMAAESLSLSSPIEPPAAGKGSTETMIRMFLWQGHGHEGIYGDDGEMQCGECGVDYKRDSLDICVEKARIAALQTGLAKLAQPTSQASSEIREHSIAFATAEDKQAALKLIADNQPNEFEYPDRLRKGIALAPSRQGAAKRVEG